MSHDHDSVGHFTIMGDTMTDSEIERLTSQELTTTPNPPSKSVIEGKQGTYKGCFCSG